MHKGVTRKTKDPFYLKLGSVVNVLCSVCVVLVGNEALAVVNADVCCSVITTSASVLLLAASVRRVASE